MAIVDEIPRAFVPPFAETVIDLDLAGLDPAARADAIDFVVHRIATMPTIPRLGVFVISAVLAPLMRTGQRTRVVQGIARTNPPIVGEYLRLVRGLLVSRVWETRQ